MPRLRDYTVGYSPKTHRISDMYLIYVVYLPFPCSQRKLSNNQSINLKKKNQSLASGFTTLRSRRIVLWYSVDLRSEAIEFVSLSLGFLCFDIFDVSTNVSQ